MPLNEKTRFSVTIGTAAALVGFFIYATRGVDKTLASIRDDMNAIRRELTDRIDKVDNATHDRWTLTAESEWAARLQINNREMRIPDPKDPSRLLSDGYKQRPGSDAVLTNAFNR